MITQVAEKQRTEAAGAAFKLDGDAGVVARFDSPQVRLRPEHAPHQGAEGARHTHARLCDSRPACRQLRDEIVVVGTRARPDECLRHHSEHGAGAADVVEVVVAEDQQVDSRDAEVAEAGGQRRADPAPRQ